ncbi:transcription termination/antitermination NusG family protein [Salmonella enterica subsp. enterica serovar Chester]
MHWYLMSFSSNRFNHVLKFLADKNINYCCPMVACYYQRPDKVNAFRKRLSPVFPGYVFVELDLTDNKLLTFSQCRYIQRLIAFGGEPVTVPQKVIDELSNRTFEECKCERGSPPVTVFRNTDDTWSDILAIRDPDARISKLLKYLEQRRDYDGKSNRYYKRYNNKYAKEAV